jgi:hypothetical protein
MTMDNILAASWKVEVIADSSGTWCSNALRFASREEAKTYGDNLASRWTAVREVRTTPSTDPPNYVFRSGALEPLEHAPSA